MTDRKKDDSSIAKVDGFKISSSRNLHWKRTTHGWKRLVEWKNVSVYWVPLKDLKQSNPDELAVFSVTNFISGEPVFKWWFK